MSQRDHYQHGVPCWVDTVQPDLEAATEFYRSLMEWTFEGGRKVDGHWSYYVAKVHDQDVAGIAPMPPMSPEIKPAWSTQVRVDNLADTVDIAHRAGGTVVVEMFDAAPAGHLAVLADPGGAIICLWQALAREGAARVNEPGAWAMSSLSSTDVKASADFYHDTFGWTTETFSGGGGEVTMFRLPGYVGGEPAQPVSREVVAVMLPRADGDADYWTPDFWVADLEATIAKVEPLGGSIARPPTDAPAGRSALVGDPAGAIFSLTQVPSAH